MPATAEDIAAGSREAVVVSWSDPAIASRYPSARDGAAEPTEGFCDQASDTQALATARGALIGTERRRFTVNIADVVWPDLSAGVPTDRLIDPEQVVNSDFLCARIELDLEAGTTSHELFG